jgi:hypothetical protein
MITIKKTGFFSFRFKKPHFTTALFLFSFILCGLVNAQVRQTLGDTVQKKNIVPDTIKPVIKIKDTLQETGVAISPSTLRFNVKPGTLQTKTIKITNDTRRSYNFQVGFQDYGPGADGETDVPVDKYSMYSLSRYCIITPTLIEIGPRQTKTISVSVDIPAGDSMAVSMWTLLDIDQVLEREKLESPSTNPNAVSMGVKNSFGFGINIYQNPPNVSITDVEITQMKFLKKEDKKPASVFMEAKNQGTGIGYCLYYLEMVNLVTGKQRNLKVKQFAIFPGYTKHFTFELPDDLEKGPYSAIAVLDFGNKEELQTAEIEFNIE